MFDRFSEEAKEALNLARKAAQANGIGYLADVHILIGCIKAQGSLAARVIVACGQHPADLCALAEVRSRQLDPGQRDSSQLPFTAEAKQLLERSMEEASDCGHRWLGTHHLLLGVLRLGNELSEMLAAAGLDLAQARQCAETVHADASPPGEPNDALEVPPQDVQLAVLQSAKHVCIALKEFQLASQLRDLIHRIEIRK